MKHKLFRLFFVLAFVFGLAMMSTPQSTRAAGPWYVSTTGNDADDCMSPTTPCATMDGAIGKASDGDTINVATGTYTGNGSYVVTITKSITLSGGWNSTFTNNDGVSTIDGQNARVGVTTNEYYYIFATIDRFIIQNSLGGITAIYDTVTLNNSAVINNVSTDNGGGIRVIGVLTLNNSTVSGNQAAGSGGGIWFFNQSGAPLILNNSTIANNSSSQGGGLAIYFYGSPQPTAILQNSIIANNTATIGPDCFGMINSSDHNIIGNTSDCTVSAGVGDQFNVDPMLDAFVLSQGYYPLLPGSPAIDTGNYATCLLTDQRGIVRPQGVTCDIGAFELEQATVPPPPNDNFADAEVVTSLPFNTTPDITGAGIQQGEPQDCFFMNRTVWYSFIPAETMNIHVNTQGSAINSNVNIYRTVGAGLSDLQFLQCSGTGGSFNFLFEAGQTYYLQAGPASGQIGTVQVNLVQVFPPTIDNFADAEVITSLPFSATPDMTDTGLEQDEPQICDGMNRTVWYSFMPTETMSVRVSTQSFMNIYQATGDGISNLQHLQCGYPNGSSHFLAEAGQTYYLQAGLAFYGSDPIQVDLQQVFPPANDLFASAEEITSLPFNTAPNVTDTGIEPGESLNCNFMNQSVWYSFTPVETIRVRTDLQGSAVNSFMSISLATGDGISDLQHMVCVESFSEPYTFLAEAEKTYYLQVSPAFGETGIIQVNLQEIPRTANDDFNNSVTINALPYSDSRDTSTATSSFDDPTSCHSSGSVWYQFTPSSDMTITANTIGSDYDTTIGVFTGLPGDLSLVPGGCNDDYYGLQSHVSFTATSGTTYYFLLGICCGSGGNGGGNLILSIEGISAPPNNNFANAEAVNSLPFSATTDVTGASNEPDEPQWCYSMPNTVWYSFTPTETMSIRADTQGGAINGNVNIFRAGTGIYDLQFLGCAGPGSSTQFLAEFGETYYLQAGAAYGEAGNIQVNLQQFFPPVNDNFANPTAITSLPFSATPDISNAGVEPNEPQNCYYMPNTVWYSFTPTENTLVRANTEGSAINSNINVYKLNGPGISNLTNLGCTIYNGPITFLAEAGQTYYFQAGGVYGQVGTIQVNLEQLPLPANDDFANATLVSSPLPFDNTVDTQYSTRQAGEPTPSCAYYGPGSRSVWYAFTPTTSGSFSAGIPSAMFTPVLAVYTGSSLTNLSQIGCQPYGSLLTFHANAGTTYYFQVSNLYPWDQGGSMQFHLDVTPPPQASFYTNPWDPSKYDTVQFQDSSYDPGQVGFQTFTWNFGDGTTANGYSATHKYAADGDYQVTHTVTTVDGRTATITQTVQVRTHDVAITRIAVPNSANAGQTKTITVTLRNIAYPETVQIDLYKSTPNGFVWVATVTRSVPVLSGNRTTAVNFNYTFTSDDARLGKVTFKAVATLVGARDAYPSDNEAISLITKVAR